mgnify:CR=1 FL=1
MAGKVKPPALKPGDMIAIVAPSGAPSKRNLNLGVKRIESYGYKIRIHPQCYLRRGYLAGDDEKRANALNEVFADKKVKAVFCARGGFGCQRLLKYLDLKTIWNNPKIFVGYSDITVLLQTFARRFVTFHGPMPAIDICRKEYHYSLEKLLRIISNPSPAGAQENPKKAGGFIRRGRGRAMGYLTGGNLSLLQKLIGTPFLPKFADKIVFLEEVDEEPYRLNGYLSHLFTASDIAKAAGFIFGPFLNCKITRRTYPSLTVEQVLDDYFGGLNVPQLWNVACGHGKENMTIPIGVMATIDAGKGIFEISEKAVV